MMFHVIAAIGEFGCYSLLPAMMDELFISRMTQPCTDKACALELLKSSRRDGLQVEVRQNKVTSEYFVSGRDTGRLIPSRRYVPPRYEKLLGNQGVDRNCDSFQFSWCIRTKGYTASVLFDLERFLISPKFWHFF